MADSYVFLDASNIEVLIHHDNGSTTTFPRWESESDNLNSDRWKQMVSDNITPSDYVARPATWGRVRSKRNQLLKDTDWQASSDRTMSDDEAVYRQALRDIPGQDVDGPGDVVWPSAP